MDRSEWVRVPRKVDRNMLRAFWTADDGTPPDESLLVDGDLARLQQEWDRLIAAAPLPPAEQAAVDSPRATAAVSTLRSLGWAWTGKGWHQTASAEQASGYDAPVAATLADAAADPALTMDAARELLADTARAITAGAYAALSQRPVVDEAMVERGTAAAIKASNRYTGAGVEDAWKVLVRNVLTAALAPQQSTGEEG